jgi:hypothetical protein
MSAYTFGTQLLDEVAIATAIATAIVTQPSTLEICECPPAALRSSLIGNVKIELLSHFEMADIVANCYRM